MRYVVVGFYSAVLEYSREERIPMHRITPVPQAGPVSQALLGLNPEETTIVLVYGYDRWTNDEARDLISRFRALGAQLLVMD